jgi:polyhydroxyalkanoate synthesis regulator phasin
LIDDWKKAFDNALVAMQTSHGKLLDEMKPEQLFKKNIEEMWRQLGLANRDETHALKDRLEQLQAQIESFQKQHQMSEITGQLERDGKFVVKEDLKPFEKAVAGLKDTVNAMGDVENLRQTVTQLGNDLGTYKDDIAHVKELVGQINPKLSALTAAIDRLSKPAGQG